MDYQDLLAHFGSCTEAARKLGLAKQTVNNWRRGIPFEQQFRIQMKTKGRLKASLPAERKKAA